MGPIINRGCLIPDQSIVVIASTAVFSGWLRVERVLCVLCVGVFGGAVGVSALL